MRNESSNIQRPHQFSKQPINPCCMTHSPCSYHKQYMYYNNLPEKFTFCGLAPGMRYFSTDVPDNRQHHPPHEYHAGMVTDYTNIHKLNTTYCNCIRWFSRYPLFSARSFTGTFTMTHFMYSHKIVILFLI